MKIAKLEFLMLLSFAVGLLFGCGGPKQTAQPEPEVPVPVIFDEPDPQPAPVREEPRPEPRDLGPSIAFIMQRIYFDFDKFDLTGQALSILADNARVLKAYPEANITIEGHCDERGTIEYNLALGDKRARSAKDYLVSLGISPSRISVISYGKERPVDYGHSESAWAQNRRAEFLRR
ncbi:MAG: peptidoglycan-associated lipoprotein Pal [bacterium]